jgi:Short C-terminal domain
VLRRSRSLARTAGRTAVIAGTATAVSGRVARSQQAQAAPPPEAPPAEAPPAPEAEAPPAADAPAPGALTPEAIAQLKQLAELRDQGILTEEEFSAQKALLLGG